MNRFHILVPVLFLAASPSVTAQQSDAEFEAEEPSACMCPRAGVWKVTNLEGWMECNALGFKRKMKAKSRNEGALWILDDDCSSLFTEAYKRKREDVLMERGRDCLFFGFAPGEEEGMEVIFDGAYKVESAEYISGEFYLDMSGLGSDCEGYRPFEIEFVEPLKEKDLAKLKKKMEPKLQAVRETLDEYQELIDKYLEETEGGKPYGGRNVQAKKEHADKEF